MRSVCVGNDIVDLANPRTQGRSRHERFVVRVLAPREQDAVRASRDPDLELWCHWAAKEAGYKAISKVVGDPPAFAHRAFEVVWGEQRPGRSSEPGSLIRRGTVSWREHRTRVSVSLHPTAVHAVAHALRGEHEPAVSLHPGVASLDAPESAWAGSLADLMPRFSAREADAIHSLASAAVRLGARGELARLLDVSERRLQIVCAPGPATRRPPRVLLDGRETDADVSLSHDGRLIAWAIWAGVPPAAVPHRPATPHPESSK